MSHLGPYLGGGNACTGTSRPTASKPTLYIIARYSRPGNPQSTLGVSYSTGMTGILAQEPLLLLN
ncbi:hypothetical protein RB213_004685 [Colletotrichum asianum]